MKVLLSKLLTVSLIAGFSTISMAKSSGDISLEGVRADRAFRVLVKNQMVEKFHKENQISHFEIKKSQDVAVNQLAKTKLLANHADHGRVPSSTIKEFSFDGKLCAYNKGHSFNGKSHLVCK